MKTYGESFLSPEIIELRDKVVGAPGVITTSITIGANASSMGKAKSCGVIAMLPGHLILILTASFAGPIGGVLVFIITR